MFTRLAVLTGMPRSGTSWIGQIVDSNPNVAYRMAPLFSYEFKNAIGHGATRAQWEEVLQGAYRSRDAYMNQTRNRTDGLYPTFERKADEPEVLVCKFDRFQMLMEEVLELFPDARMAGVVRHPCGAIHSWLTARPKEFPPDADPLVHWRSGACKKSEFGDRFGFDDWKLVTETFVRLAAERPRQFRLVRYEDFVVDARGQTEALFAHLGLEVGPQTVDFIDRSQSEEVEGVYSVFKPASVKDRWRDELQPEIRDAIYADLAGGSLESFLS